MITSTVECFLIIDRRTWTFKMFIISFHIFHYIYDWIRKGLVLIKIVLNQTNKLGLIINNISRFIGGNRKIIGLSFNKIPVFQLTSFVISFIFDIITFAVSFLPKFWYFNLSHYFFIFQYFFLMIIVISYLFKNILLPLVSFYR